MSCSLVVILESGPIPADVVPPDMRSCGQNICHHLAQLAPVAARLGVPPLDAFVYDSYDAIEVALTQADWQHPDPSLGGGDEIAIGGLPPTDPAFLAAMAEYAHVVDQVAAQQPWYSPTEGLLTVRALIEALNTDEALAEQCYGSLWDLQQYCFELEYAERSNTRFHFEY